MPDYRTFYNINKMQHRINLYLDATGILNDKARRFFLYSICNTLPDLQIGNKSIENNIIRRYVELLPKANFPFFNRSRKLLICPADIILNEILYTDWDLSRFFFMYAKFILLLEILHEIYPECFEFLSTNSYWVPSPKIKNHNERVAALCKKYMADSKSRIPESEKPKINILEDKRLCQILTQLSGCHYLPLSSDFTAHNKSIFSSIKG